MIPAEFKQWVTDAHAKTNHWYDEQRGVQYKFHLELTASVGRKFRQLLRDNYSGVFGVKEPDNGKSAWSRDIWECIVEPACYGHDAIEDARLTYNDVFKRSNSGVADICSALTNAGYGKNRESRMPMERYVAILDTPFAVFVKLCDRIANVRYSMFWESNMFELYKAEQKHFKQMLYKDVYMYSGRKFDFSEMWDYLDQLFETKF